MHLQTLATTINQSSIGKVRLPLTMLHHKKIPRPNGLGMWWTVQDSNSNDDDRCLRQKQGGVVGAAF